MDKLSEIGQKLLKVKLGKAEQNYGPNWTNGTIKFWLGRQFFLSKAALAIFASEVKKTGLKIADKTPIWIKNW